MPFSRSPSLILLIITLLSLAECVFSHQCPPPRLSIQLSEAVSGKQAAHAICDDLRKGCRSVNSSLANGGTYNGVGDAGSYNCYECVGDGKFEVAYVVDATPTEIGLASLILLLVVVASGLHIWLASVHPLPFAVRPKEAGIRYFLLRMLFDGELLMRRGEWLKCPSYVCLRHGCLGALVAHCACCCLNHNNACGRISRQAWPRCIQCWHSVFLAGAVGAALGTMLVVREYEIDCGDPVSTFQPIASSSSTLATVVVIAVQLISTLGVSSHIAKVSTWNRLYQSSKKEDQGGKEVGILDGAQEAEEEREGGEEVVDAAGEGGVVLGVGDVEALEEEEEEEEEEEKGEQAFTRPHQTWTLVQRISRTTASAWAILLEGAVLLLLTIFLIGDQAIDSALIGLTGIAASYLSQIGTLYITWRCFSRRQRDRYDLVWFDDPDFDFEQHVDWFGRPLPADGKQPLLHQEEAKE